MLILCVAAFLSFARQPKWALRLLRVSVIAILFIAIVPIGALVTAKLEKRFPINPPLPQQVHGIIILGGIVNAPLSHAWKSPQMASGIERITVGAELALNYPDAQVIFSGGSGDPFNPEMREAHVVPPIFQQLGLDPARVIFDDQARNTVENAQITRQIMQPKSGENWVLVTSASHMPRAVGTFRQAGWSVIPFPVDYTTDGTEELNLQFNFQGGLSRLTSALHEIIGLGAYWLTGRSDSWYPGPNY